MGKEIHDYVICGEKVSLRKITPEDTELIVKWRNNKRVRENFVFKEPFTKELHENWYKTRIIPGFVEQFIICENGNEHRPVGSVYFRDIDEKNRSAEFGIFIGEGLARGRGLGSEATRIFCDFGFSGLKLHRIMLRVFSDNKQALKSYINAGFEVEGEFRDMVASADGYRSMTFMAKIEEV